MCTFKLVVIGLLIQHTTALLKCPDEASLSPYYFECIKNNLLGDYVGFETEYRSAVDKLLHKCFAASPSDAKPGFCVLDADDYATDAFNDTQGPLKHCSVCRQVTTMLKGFLLSTDDKTLTNFRMTVADTLVEDMKKCLGSYSYPKIPDVEIGEHSDMKQKLDVVSEYMTARSRLIECQKLPSSDVLMPNGVESMRCMTERYAMKADMPKHCASVQMCATANITKVCCLQVNDAVDRNCQCMDAKKQFYVKQLLSSSATLAKAKTKDECLQVLSDLFKTDDGLNWMSTIDKTVAIFIPSVKMSQVMNRLCVDMEELVQKHDEQGLKEHLANIDGMLNFTALMFDAMFSHLMDRFCHCQIDCSMANAGITAAGAAGQPTTS